MSEAGRLEDEHYIRAKLYGGEKSSLRRYADLVVGEHCSYRTLAKYELITFLFGGLRGALGLFLRKHFYRPLFRSVGRNVIFGRNLTIRHGSRIDLGDDVILDDDCVLDARGAGDEGIVIGNRVIVNRGASIQAKIGPISIGDDTDIGMRSDIHSQGGVRIGREVTLAGSTKIGGGRFRIERSGAAAADDGVSFDAREQVRVTAGPVVIGDKTLVGMGAMFLDGVVIGEGSIIGAGSVCVRGTPPWSVAAGVPARVLKMRDGSAPPAEAPAAAPPTTATDPAAVATEPERARVAR